MDRSHGENHIRIRRRFPGFHGIFGIHYRCKIFCGLGVCSTEADIGIGKMGYEGKEERRYGCGILRSFGSWEGELEGQFGGCTYVRAGMPNLLSMHEIPNVCLKSSHMQV
jgi:hypothetical protein